MISSKFKKYRAAGAQYGKLVGKELEEDEDIANIEEEEEAVVDALLDEKEK